MGNPNPQNPTTLASMVHVINSKVGLETPIKSLFTPYNVSKWGHWSVFNFHSPANVLIT